MPVSTLPTNQAATITALRSKHRDAGSTAAGAGRRSSGQRSGLLSGLARPCLTLALCAGLLTTCSSCLMQRLRHFADNSTVPAVYEQPASQSLAQVDTAIHRVETNGAASLATPRTGRPAVNPTASNPESATQLASWQMPGTAPQGVSLSGAAMGVQRLGQSRGAAARVATVGGANVGCPPADCEICPVEPRTPVYGPNPFAPGAPGNQCCTAPSPRNYPDEYLCDGGDRDDPVHYSATHRMGLDTEDTVVEFTDHHGKERMRKSNKVCIYAPRFAAVRVVSQPIAGEGRMDITGLAQTVSQGGVHMGLGITNAVKRDGSQRVNVRSRASGVDNDQTPDNVREARGLRVAEKVQNTFENDKFLKTGRVDTAALARLNLAIRAAVDWSREQSPMITARTERDLTTTGEVRSSVIKQFDDQKTDEPGQLRLVKLVDHPTAQPGDEVTFTLRYDNLGPNPVHTVRIVDNLTPRLEYIPQSTSADRELVANDEGDDIPVEDNLEGSLILIWELTEPLPAGQGGVITFRCRVR